MLHHTIYYIIMGIIYYLMYFKSVCIDSIKEIFLKVLKYNMYNDAIKILIVVSLNRCFTRDYNTVEC